MMVESPMIWPNHAVHAPLSVMRPKVGTMSQLPVALAMEHGLVEARTPTPRLVHDERRQIVAHGIGMPALPAIRRRIQRRARMCRAVNEDDRPLAARLRDLELHVGLPDRDLLGITGGRTCSVFRDLGYAADKE